MWNSTMVDTYIYTSLKGMDMHSEDWPGIYTARYFDYLAQLAVDHCQVIKKQVA